MPSRPLGKALRALLIIGVIGSILVRLPNLVSPLLDNHGFRQTQTAFTVQCYLTDGFSILHPRMPVFGPPWETPFEFPLFQLSAGLLAKATGFEVDLACRVTGLLYFYASAAALFALCRHVVGPRPAGIILLTYLFNPFTIVWSRTSLVEFAAVTFALLYVDLSLRWLNKLASWKLLLLTMICGSLGALTKITTMAVTVPPILIFTVDSVIRARGTKKRTVFAFLGWGALTLVPVLIGQLWTHHADAIKLQSPLAATLASTAPEMIKWNFGTVVQRADLAAWATIYERMFRFLIMPSLIAAPLVALVTWARLKRSARLFLLASLLAIFFPVALFFNLFAVHDYYLCAVAPFIAVLVGSGIEQSITLLRNRTAPAAARFALCGIVLAVAGGFLLETYHRAKGYLRPSYTIDYTHPIVAIGEKISQLGDASDPVIIVHNDTWDPSILYYARRKGVLMWRHEPGMQTLLNDRFPAALVVISEPASDVLALWRNKTLLSASNDLQVWRVDDFIGQSGIH